MLESLPQARDRIQKGKCSLVDVHQLSVLVLLIISGIFSPVVFAEGEFVPYVGLTVAKDDNLYRLDSDVDVSVLSSSVSRADTIYKTRAGVAVNWKLSRQKVFADLSVTDNRFEKNSSLNYTGQDLSLKWNWLFGSYLTGQLGWSQEQTLSDFSNTNSELSSKKYQQAVNFLAKWRYAPDWEVGLDLSGYDLSYELQALQDRDRQGVKKAFFWSYITHAGNRVGVTWAREDGLYPERGITDVDNEYQQDSLLLNVVWQATVKSKLSADVGWNSRVHPTLSMKNYDGFNAKVAYTWLPTAKTMLSVDLYRQLVSSSNADATFSENTGYALNGALRLSEKVFFNGQFKSETRDYVGRLSEFKERYVWLTAGVTYQPYSMLDTSLRVSQSMRDSTQALRDYQSQSVVLDFKVKF